MTADPRPSFWNAFGPGVLFAGAAVGVSHLVQSTRAGASYGLALAGVVVLANLVKYPAFRLGPQYAAATGTSMLEGYRRRGLGALLLYTLVTLATMFAVQAAVTFVTAGLLLSLLGSTTSAVLVSAGLLALCLGLVAIGDYAWLDRVTKVAVAIFTLATFVATALALGRVDWSGALVPDLGRFEKADWLFCAALVGWMPSAIDVSVWQSIWVLARAKDRKRRPDLRGTLLDFHVGYVGTAALALCFLLLGAGIIHGRDLEIPTQAHAFGAMLVDLYAETLGAWSRPIVGGAAFLVMFSTTLTVVDGFPRALAVLSERFGGAEVPPDDPAVATPRPRARRTYAASALLLVLGSLGILAFAASSLRALVDFATTASFLTAPVLSALNHAAAMGPEVPEHARMSPTLRWSSLAGIAAQALIAAGWIWLITSG
ncbi:MAG: divalent metal cation transporter [Myxococcales bacterium]|nr:divalent metal cation transporter [Myxococcales bacterium]